jgi:hypothetical protein
MTNAVGMGEIKNVYKILIGKSLSLSAFRSNTDPET